MPAQPLSPELEGEPSRATKERLLDAAERLFTERGFRGTSMRAVTQSAGVAVSAANYHFGSKQALLAATLRRRVDPINRRRLEQLDALESDAGDAPLQVESILEALLRPIIDGRARTSRNLRHVVACLFTEPPDRVAALKRDLFGEVIARFSAALARALPGRSSEEIALGYQLTVGVMMFALSGHLEKSPELAERHALSDEELLCRLIAYAAAGLRAPTEELP